MASKKYPPGQKPSMADSYKSATKSTKPPKGSAAANRAALANVGKNIVGFFAKGGIPAVGKPEGFNKPAVTPPKPNRDQAMADAYKTAQIVGNKPSAIIKQQSQPTKASVTATTSTKPAVKPYKALKNPEAEKARQEFVNQRLAKRGIKVAKKGQPRSAEEKAARAQARATYGKRKKKSVNNSTMSVKAQRELEQ
jgi:hypothetical protein